MYGAAKRNEIEEWSNGVLEYWSVAKKKKEDRIQN